MTPTTTCTGKTCYITGPRTTADDPGTCNCLRELPAKNRAIVERRLLALEATIAELVDAMDREEAETPVTGEEWFGALDRARQMISATPAHPPRITAADMGLIEAILDVADEAASAWRFFPEDEYATEDAILPSEIMIRLSETLDDLTVHNQKKEEKI